jgi:hypothetical protein
LHACNWCPTLLHAATRQAKEKYHESQQLRQQAIEEVEELKSKYNQKQA